MSTDPNPHTPIRTGDVWFVKLPSGGVIGADGVCRARIADVRERVVAMQRNGDIGFCWYAISDIEWLEQDRSQ